MLGGFTKRVTSLRNCVNKGGENVEHVRNGGWRGTGKYPLVDALGGFGVLIGEQPFLCSEAGEKVCGSQLAVAGLGPA